MKILHISDCHGFKHRLESGEMATIFPTIKEEFDVVVCSGDMYPNKNWGANRKKELFKEEINYQNNWFLSNLKNFTTFIQSKPFFWVSGNHDWTNPVSILCQNGIKAYNLDDKVINVLGFSWAGFPYIPIINNNWNYEKDSSQMRQEFIKLINRLKLAAEFSTLDILVAHCPIAGILDFNELRGGHLGNTHMDNFLNYQLENKPKFYLCGHVHEQGGKIETIDGMIVSNAATTWNIIEVKS